MCYYIIMMASSIFSKKSIFFFFQCIDLQKKKLTIEASVHKIKTFNTSFVSFSAAVPAAHSNMK